MTKYQVVARYFPHRMGHEQQHRFITGNNRADVIEKAKAANPDPVELYFAAIWASPDGPAISHSDIWLPEADKYIPQ